MPCIYEFDFDWQFWLHPNDSLMIITTAYILPPNQISFHEKGLKPDYEIFFTLISMDLLISSLSNFHDLPDK